MVTANRSVFGVRGLAWGGREGLQNGTRKHWGTAAMFVILIRGVGFMGGYMSKLNYTLQICLVYCMSVTP